MVYRTTVTESPGRAGPSATAPTPIDASRTLADLGFLVHSDVPDATGPAFTWWRFANARH